MSDVEDELGVIDEAHCYHHDFWDCDECRDGVCDREAIDYCVCCDCCCTCLACEYGPRDGMLMTEQQRAAIAAVDVSPNREEIGHD